MTLHGHAHPRIAEAIARQAFTMEQVIFAGFSHEPAARLAGNLVSRLPRGLTRVFYSDDGSTAVEVALKMALQYWRNQGQDRPLVAALQNAYHGDTFGAMSASARGTFNASFAEHLFEVARLPDPSEADTVAALTELLDTRGTELAAVIVEPLLLGSGGMRMWSPDALRDIRELTRQAGVLLIADEVLTGFGRTGPLFACELAGILPDIICLAKGITGGFLPMGATVVREEIFEAFTSDDRRLTFFHGHSYTANPIACAAGLASLELLDEHSAARRADIERAHRVGLSKITEFPTVRAPRILGTIGAFDIDTPGGYLASVGPAVTKFALEHGVYIRPLGNVVYVMPPYCTTADEIAHVYDVIARFLESKGAD